MTLHEFLNCLPEAEGRSAMERRGMRERAHGRTGLPLLQELISASCLVTLYGLIGVTPEAEFLAFRPPIRVQA